MPAQDEGHPQGLAVPTCLALMLRYTLRRLCLSFVSLTSALVMSYCEDQHSLGSQGLVGGRNQARDLRRFANYFALSPVAALRIRG